MKFSAIVVLLLVPTCIYGKKVDNEDVLQLISEMLKVSPPFHLSHPAVTKSCSQNSDTFLKSLKNSELWAMKMYDSSAKLPSGILHGNILQFGDFDQCLNVLAPENSFQGKYCLAYLQPKVSNKNGSLENLRKMIQAFDFLKSEFEMSGHISPRFSTILWGLCVPSTCTGLDVELVLNETLKYLTEKVGFDLRIQVNDEMCYVKEQNDVLDKNTKIVIMIFVAIFVISVLSTYYDNSNRNAWLTAFSLKKNLNQLTVIKENPSDIKSAHGIRGFSVLFLLVAHKSEEMLFNPFINRSELGLTLGKSISAFTRSSIIYTDAFLMLSAMLTSYSYFGKLKKGEKIQIFKEFVGRYIRIIPPVAALILFTIFIFPLMGTGPQWNVVVQPQTDLCTKYWWRNLLLIQNFYGFEKICLTNTHYIAVDTQLFLVTSFLVLLVWKFPKRGIQILVGLTIFTVFARFYVVYSKELSDFIYYGISTSHLFTTIDYIYIKPFYRLSSCTVGILLGYILRNHKHIVLSKKQVRIGWFLSTISLIMSVMAGAPMSKLGYIYQPLHAAIFAAFSPLGWCLSIAWIIFIAENGRKSYLVKLVELKGFVLVTRMAYCIYLVQYLVFNYNIGTRRNSDHFGMFKTILDLNELFMILLVSVLLTLFIELPFCNIKGILLNPKIPKESEKDSKSK